MNFHTRLAARRRHKMVAAGAALFALAGLMTQASAHVTVGNPTLHSIQLNFRAPVEPVPTTPEELAAHHTEKVSVKFPAGFKIERCHETGSFACTSTVDSAEWVRRAGDTSYKTVDFFKVSVRTPGVGGTYLVPAIQTYSSGEVVEWKDRNTTDPRPAPQIRVNGVEQAPPAAAGVFRPLSELGGGNPCPQSVIDEAVRLGIDPAVHCGHYGFEPPEGAPAPPAPPSEEPEIDIRGTAEIVRTSTRTYVQVQVTGLEPGLTYLAHLHEGTCGDPTSAHYKNDPAGPAEPPNELWPSSDPADATAGLTADSAGVANGFAIAEWVARPTARAIWVHSPDDGGGHGGHGGHARIGCADLV